MLVFLLLLAARIGSRRQGRNSLSKLSAELRRCYLMYYTLYSKGCPLTKKMLSVFIFSEGGIPTNSLSFLFQFLALSPFTCQGRGKSTWSTFQGHYKYTSWPLESQVILPLYKYYYFPLSIFPFPFFSFFSFYAMSPDRRMTFCLFSVPAVSELTRVEISAKSSSGERDLFTSAKMFTDLFLANV